MNFQGLFYPVLSFAIAVNKLHSLSDPPKEGHLCTTLKAIFTTFHSWHTIAGK